MALKITSFNPFDKGFFGSTLMKSKPLPKNFTPSKIEHDSIDDLNKYFHQQILNAGKMRTKTLSTVKQTENMTKESKDSHTLFMML